MTTRLANALYGGPGFGLYGQGRIPGQNYERSSDMPLANTQLTEAGNNMEVLFAVYPCYTNDKNQ